MFARIETGAIIGVDAVPVSVEVDTGPGLSSFQVVGLPDGSIREARVRVRAAISNSGIEWPIRNISVNLAPADIRKDGTAFDLPIALGVLGACGMIRKKERARLERLMVAGELSLDGELRPVRGALSLAIAAREAGLEGILLPAENATEARLVRGISIVACGTLNEALAFIRGEGEQFIVPEEAEALLPRQPGSFVDMAEVRGQETARRALEVAAAGGHNILLVGPPGSGKTMLSRRVPTILPPMTFDEALETTKVHSVAGLVSNAGLVGERPFRAPHHTISEPGLVGGGSGMPRPGEVSLAHNGVLFLDELPEFRRGVLEVLRQPLEDGEINVNRSLIAVRYPARVMLVASMNPCPCGYLGDPKHNCRCTVQQVEAYRGRISGPLLDRLDIHIDVPAVSYDELRGLGTGEDSATIRERVDRARTRQRSRLQDTGRFCNAQMDTRLIRAHCEVEPSAHELLERVVDKLGMSARAHSRILKVARTIADLAGQELILTPHVAEAIRYRKMDRRPGT